MSISCGIQCLICDYPIHLDTYKGCSHACEYCFVKNLLKTFTFPIEKKQQITSYLKKHIREITEEIIDKAVTIWQN